MDMTASIGQTVVRGPSFRPGGTRPFFTQFHQQLGAMGRMPGVPVLGSPQICATRTRVPGGNFGCVGVCIYHHPYLSTKGTDGQMVRYRQL